MFTSVSKYFKGPQRNNFIGIGAREELITLDDERELLLYTDCITKDEKIRWLQSDIGQYILAQRPVLAEYYRTGYMFRLLDNPAWKIRLEEWLTLTEESSDKVPYGLQLPKTEEEKDKERNDWLEGQPHHNPPLNEVFGDHFRYYSSSSINFKMTIENRLQILTDGFTILRDVVPIAVVNNACSAISMALSAADPQRLIELGLHADIAYATADERKKSMRPKERVINEKARDPFFLSFISNNLAVLALYYASPAHAIIEQLLHGDNNVNSGDINRDFRHSVGAGQVAFRFTDGARSQHNAKLGGLNWHLDGLERGQYGSFSFLVGFALSDQKTDYSGNLCLHPGSHYQLQPWLKEYALRSAACTNAEERQHVKQLPKPDLGEPVQVQISAGDVVIVLHKVAHRGGPNFSTDVRKMVYFRVSHRRHEELRYQALDDIWIEYEGLHDLL